MTDERSCERTRELAPELALGIADGEERAAALEHLAACPECRRYLDELATSADELLALAPPHEPPLGFEQRVLGQILPARRSRRRLLAPIAAAATAAVAAAAAVWIALADDRDIADRYRATLEVADGEYLSAAPLEAPGGARVGTLYGYQGSPSWVLVAVVPPRAQGGAPAPDGARDLPAGAYTAELVAESGEKTELGRFHVASGAGSLGKAIPLDYHDIAEVRIVRAGEGEVADADLDD